MAEGIADVSSRDMADDTQVEMGASTKNFRGRKGSPGGPQSAMGLLIYLNDSSGTHSGGRGGRQVGSLIMFKKLGEPLS